MSQLILASTSPYRRELLERLRLPFSVESPGIDETPLAGEASADLAVRLACGKAKAVADRNPRAIVIGADQVASLDGHSIGQPHTHERAVQQLRAMSGRQVVFHTAVSVIQKLTGFSGSAIVPVVVIFRSLTDSMIERYLRLEQPYDCAGSAKSEALGIALLQSVLSDDPTALIGLPLIRTCELLSEAGLDPLSDPDTTSP